ncbi:peptidase C14 [Chryseotalea sanaruensis]|uniref:Peptidase C14 n=1 Tax=Chryseotalea sanaruensis TaxID=2482724 RepID=A0A401U7R8_9BACT|nr:caspase family protein [Chryseotalea sanaruensis]GCC50933.1 peptidase C14 [Chryseotalea sanaruensis]
MKKRLFSLALTILSVAVAMAQNVSTRTNEFEVDFSDPKRLVYTTIPVINWITPVQETNYAQENKFKIRVEIDSDKPIKNIIINVKESEQSASRGSSSIQPTDEEKLHTVVERNITLMDGDNLLEIIAENIDGQKTISYRKVTVGSTSLADATKLDRTDYALIFATDEYDHWGDLVNPVFDSRTIAAELKNTYGFKVDVLENGTQADVLKKIREYAEKKYKPLDQLLIFFAGHGNYDQTFGEGFVVTRESLINDEAKTTYLSHNRLRSIINNIPCEHIFLAMDVCFGGTFDAALASSRGIGDEVYKEQNTAEFITRKLTYKTRRFLTSGGKTYVSDGIAGKHSPFAKNVIEALRSRGGRDGVLTLPEIYSYVEKLKIQPRFGEFGDNAPGSDFVFVAR